jgi:uncharacterized damage-inducible protein DinB
MKPALVSLGKCSDLAARRLSRLKGASNMQRVKLWTVGLVVLGLATASCAAPVGEPDSSTAADGASAATTIASVRAIHDTATEYITATAEQVSEDLYSFRPAGAPEEVRTMGQILGHIAGATIFFCSTASGQEPLDIGNVEEMASKADIQQALSDAFGYCDGAFAAIEANSHEVVELLGVEHSRVGALAFNNAHNFEHYGNLVTYMRINGMVPPSSQQTGGN